MVRDGEKGGKRPGDPDDTLQVRIRTKHPLIERLASERDDSNTVVQMDGPLADALIENPLIGGNNLRETTARTEKAVGQLPEEPPPRARRKSRRRRRKKSPAPPGAKTSTAKDRAHTTRTEEKPPTPPPSPDDAPTAPPETAPAAFLDEDETVVADGPPGAPPPQVQKPAPDEAPTERPSPGTSQGAVPQRRIVGSGTKAAGAAVHRMMIDRIEQALPNVTAPVLKPLRGELTQDEIGALESTLSGDLDANRVEAAVSPKRSLEHLVNEPRFHDLSSKERALLLKAVAGEPRNVATSKAALALLKSGVAKRLRDDDRITLLTTFLVLPTEIRGLLAALAARQLRSRSALEDRDIEDVPLVQHLFALASGKAFAGQLEDHGLRQRAVAPSVLAAIARPETLTFDEGSNGVLGSIEFGLAESSPADFARLWRQLTSGDMVANLADDTRIDLAERIRSSETRFSQEETPLRIGLEQLINVVLSRRSADRSSLVMPGGHGVDADVISRVLGQLYGIGFTVAAGAPTALRQLGRLSDGPQRVPPVFVSVLYDRGERLFVFDHIDERDIYVRAPHGKSTKRPGALRIDPPRQVVDETIGLDLMPVEAFKTSIGVALIPRT